MKMYILYNIIRTIKQVKQNVTFYMLNMFNFTLSNHTLMKPKCKNYTVMYTYREIHGV